MDKQTFIDEIGMRGKIDIVVLPTNTVANAWFFDTPNSRLVYLGIGLYTVQIYKVAVNPPDSAGQIVFYEYESGNYVETLPTEWLLRIINELPFVITGWIDCYCTSPANYCTSAKILVDNVEKGVTKETEYVRIPIEPGRHIVQYVLEGIAKSEPEEVIVIEGEGARYYGELKGLTKTVTITANTACKLFVNDELKGTLD